MGSIEYQCTVCNRRSWDTVACAVCHAPLRRTGRYTERTARATVSDRAPKWHTSVVTSPYRLHLSREMQSALLNTGTCQDDLEHIA